jgi:nitrogen fixation/metabolism regulation signal transduction histidine kinase
VSNLKRTLLMRGSRLPVTPVAGYVVVFDDVTDLAQAQRDAAWGEVARRLAHEIKNPLTPIQLSAERLERKLAPKLSAPDQETLARGAQTIIAQVAAMKHMVDDFAIYARRARPGTMQHNLRPHVRLSLPSEPLVVQGEATRLRQVFHNLLQNAIDAQAELSDPRYDITGEARGEEIGLTFRDGGAGFPDTVLHRAFEPYVTTKSKGTGLGLAIVKKIVDEHHGRVELANASPRGGQVTLIFPRSTAAA